MLRRALTAVALVTACLAAGALSTRDSSAITLPQTYIVDTISDANLTACDRFTPGDCSLRGAINDANTHPGFDHIYFGIGPGGIQTITPTAALPDITGAVDIDATGQQENGQSCIDIEQRPCIVLDGTSAGANVSGLTLAAPGVTVRGLAIVSFHDAGVYIGRDSGNDTMVRNYIGTADGSTAAPNKWGVLARSDQSNIIVGGTTPAERNVISGNTATGVDFSSVGANHVIRGNYIGTNASGTVALPNGDFGVIVSGRNNTIGGTDTGAGNVISGNTGIGVFVWTNTGNVIAGNLIGTSADGQTALPNKIGVKIGYYAGVTIGGTTASARNVISGNTSHGVHLEFSGFPTAVIQGNYIGTNVTGTSALGNGGDGIHAETVFGIGQATIGGSAAGAGNLISGNVGAGMYLTNISGATVQGNYIGTTADGTQPIGNQQDGISFSDANGSVMGNTISSNLISGNEHDGVRFDGAGVHSNGIFHNLIGTDVTGTIPIVTQGDGIGVFGSTNNEFQYNTIVGGQLSVGVNLGLGATGNSFRVNYIGTNADGAAGLGGASIGVYINGAPGNQIGSEAAPLSADGAHVESAAGGGNYIWNSLGAGIKINGAAATGDTISGNSIDNNGGLGIDLVAGGNGNAAAPVLTSALTTGGNTEVHGSYTNDPQHDFRAEFFASPSCDPSGNGEGRDFLGAATIHTDGSGIATFAATVPGSTGGKAITATVTVPASGNTSEFSNCVTATGPTPTPSPTPSPTHSPTATPHATPTPTATPSGLNGDANCDGKVDPTDALAILGDAGGVTPHAPCQNAEDVDCDGHVDGLDALRVLRWFIGAPMSHLPGCPEVGDPLT